MPIGVMYFFTMPIFGTRQRGLPKIHQAGFAAIFVAASTRVSASKKATASRTS